MTIKKTSLLLLLFITEALCGPISVKDDDKLVIDKDLFLEEFIIHKADHDIVNIIIPINDLNFQDTDIDSNNKDDSESVTLFFVEADIKQDTTEYKGVSILKNGKVKKLLKNGRDAVSGDTDTKDVFFAATDGLYSYDPEHNEAKKYGSLNDNLVAITKVNGSDVFYVINDKNELFKVTEKGTKKELVTDAKDAKEIVCIPDGTLFYVDGKNDIYVMKETGVAKISGIPDSKNSVILLRPMILAQDNETIAIVDKTPYVVYVNGTAEKLNVELKVKPTAYAMDATLIQYYAVDKNIYEYNVLLILLSNVLDQLSDFINGLRVDINALAGKKIA